MQNIKNVWSILNTWTRHALTQPFLDGVFGEQEIMEPMFKKVMLDAVKADPEAFRYEVLQARLVIKKTAH